MNVTFADNFHYDEELDSLYEQRRDREVEGMIKRREKDSHHEPLRPLPKIKQITTKLKQVNP